MCKQKKFLLSVIVFAIMLLPVIANAVPVSWTSENYTASVYVDSPTNNAGDFDSGPVSATANADIGACSASATSTGSSMFSSLYA